MEKTTILFIQGGGEGAYEVDHKLVVNLEQALKGISEIVYPKMSGENDPDYQRWKAAIDAALAKIDGPVILMGHSVGSFLLLKYVLETKIDKEIVGLFFIATPFVGAEGWEFEDMAIKEELFSKPFPAPMFFFHSTNDTTAPFSHLSLYEKKFPHATFRQIVGRGHQLNNDLSEVAADIKGLI
jgi:predicted alpha/beta hydrolase family esterase